MPFGEFAPLAPELLPLLTDAERAAYQKALQRHVALQSPLDFGFLTTPETVDYAHVRLLNTLIVALVEHRLYETGPCPHPAEDLEGLLCHPEEPCSVPGGEPARLKLFVTMPPRHGKSYLLSEHTPAWYIARYPERRVIFSTYEADFAKSFGAKGRDLIEQHGEMFGIELDKRSTAADHWNIKGKRGGMQTAGAGGAITGKGAQLMICDDPIKNQEEALSEVFREKMENWWDSTFKTRREPGGVIVLIHTRWHEDDLGGRLLKREASEWFHVDLPALQPEDLDGLQDTGLHSGAKNPLAREAGAALCPARYTREYLLRERKANPMWFDAMYQQQPSTEGAGIFRRQDFRYWQPGGTPAQPRYDLILPSGGQKYVPVSACYHFQTIDLAATTKTYSDYTVISTWALTPDKEILLADRYRERVEAANHEDEWERVFRDLGRRGVRVRMAGVEKMTYGLNLITKLSRKRLCPIRPLAADKDKYTRTLPAGEACMEGIFYWPAAAPWLKEWEDEHIQFPNGAHDDQVDTTAYAAWLLYMGGLNYRKPDREREPATLQEKVDKKLREMSRRKKGGRRHPDLGLVG